MDGECVRVCLCECVCAVRRSRAQKVSFFFFRLFFLKLLHIYIKGLQYSAKKSFLAFFLSSFLQPPLPILHIYFHHYKVKYTFCFWKRTLRSLYVRCLLSYAHVLRAIHTQKKYAVTRRLRRGHTYTHFFLFS